MTPGAASPGVPGSEGAGGDQPFAFHDKRKVDPVSGSPRARGPQAADGESTVRHRQGGDHPGDPLAGLDFEVSADTAELAAAKAQLAAAQEQSAEHLDALQRERASFTNYRNRSLREQEAARVRGVEDVLTGLLPVLDAIERARGHGELDGPMATISSQLEESLAKFGVERYGAVGDVFDPHIHEAFMHREVDTVTEPTVELVIEPGYRIGEKLVRAARVGVVGPA